MTRPAALLLTPVVPRPDGTGLNLRAWAWLEELSSRYSVRVIVFGASDANSPIGSPQGSIGFVEVRPLAQTRWRRSLAVLLPFLVRWKGFGSDWPQIPDEAPLSAAIDGFTPDLIVVFRLYLHDVARPVLERFPNAQTAVDMDDFESRTRRSIALAHWRLGRWRSGLQALALSVQYGLAERLLARDYDTVYVAAPEDRQRLNGRTQANVRVFPNRLAPQPYASESPRSRLLFVGSLDYAPNELAARWLMQMVPALRARLPQFVPTIIGRRPNVALRRRLASCEGLDFVEDATNLSGYYNSAVAVLVPLSAGGGTKFKTIEAFAHACPVVSTSEGARGLGAVPGHHYLLAETAEEFVHSVGRIAHDPGMASRLGHAGYCLWRDGFSL